MEDATQAGTDRPLWRLLAASGATHWNECKPNSDDDDDDDDTLSWEAQLLLR